MLPRPKRLWLYVAVLMLAAEQACAQIVIYGATDLGGGLFEYSLLVDATGASEPVAGLNVLRGGSVFDLNPGIPIGAPAGWDFFAPDPLLGIDVLEYFSLTPSTDIPIGGSLGGFRFESVKEPDTILGDAFAVELIGRTSGKPVFRGVAQAIPEPSGIVFVAAGVAVSWTERRLRRRKR